MATTVTRDEPGAGDSRSNSQTDGAVKSLLTHRQAQLLEFIERFHAEHSIGPTRVEMARALSLEKGASITNTLRALERRKLVEVRRQTSRGTTPTRTRAVPIIQARPAGGANVEAHVCGQMAEIAVKDFAVRPDLVVLIDSAEPDAPADCGDCVGVIKDRAPAPGHWVVTCTSAGMRFERYQSQGTASERGSLVGIAVGVLSPRRVDHAMPSR